MKFSPVRKVLFFAALICAPITAQANWFEWALSFFKSEKPVTTAPADANALNRFTTAISEQATKSGDSMLQSLGTDLNKHVTNLAKSLNASPEQLNQLNHALSAVQEDFSIQEFTTSLNNLGSLAASGLSEQQIQTLTQTLTYATAYGLQHYLKDTPIGPDVNTAVAALRKGDYTAALQPITRIAQSAELSPEHKAMVNTASEYFKKLGGKAALDGARRLFGNS